MQVRSWNHSVRLQNSLSSHHERRRLQRMKTKTQHQTTTLHQTRTNPLLPPPGLESVNGDQPGRLVLAVQHRHWSRILHARQARVDRSLLVLVVSPRSPCPLQPSNRSRMSRPRLQSLFIKTPCPARPRHLRRTEEVDNDVAPHKRGPSPRPNANGSLLRLPLLTMPRLSLHISARATTSWLPRAISNVCRPSS